MSRPSETAQAMLFGLTARQVGFIDEAQLVAGFRGWNRDGAVSLADHLIGRGDLDEDQAEAVWRVAALLERKYGGAEECLRAFRLSAPLRDLLGELADHGLTATTSVIAPGPAGGAGDCTATYHARQPEGDRARPPDERDRFRVLRRHARGGLGEVFVALDGQLNREVALKQIRDDRDDPSSRLRFLREAELTGRLEHPGVVPVYALGAHADGRPYYAMRLIRGESLREVISKYHAATEPPTSVSFRRLLRPLLDACEAVEYAHSQGVLHRDLKPANVVVGKHGETLVVDWGLAKSLGDADPDPGGPAEDPASAAGGVETAPGRALGTPAYMSPEQAAGDLAAVGPRSDVYALGATLYCILTGRAPYEGGDLDGTLRRVREGDLVPPRRVKATLDESIEAVCLRAMARRPEDRYASCRDLADDLERWLADEPVSARRDPWNVRLARRLRRSAVPATAAAALLAGAVLGLAVLLAVVLPRFAAVVGAEGDALPSLLAVQGERYRDTLFEVTSLVALASAPEGTAAGGDRARALGRAIAVQERLVREHPDRVPLRLDLADAYRAAARLARAEGNHLKAVESLGQAVATGAGVLEQIPGSSTLEDRLAEDQDALAWLLATSPNPLARDGARAVGLAEKVCEGARRQNPLSLDTLAAALARSGDFGRAVRVAREAVRLAPDRARPEIEERLRGYESGKPFTEQGTGTPSATLH